MQIKTWLQRLTDESNLWFNAVKTEDEGLLGEATSYYLKDALECIKQHSLVRVALSCSCAANCLARMGALSEARKLYLEAASTYVENSDAVISESIREALWSLQEAFENYILGDNTEAANAIKERYLKLAARTSAFFRAELIEKELELRRESATEMMRKLKAPTGLENIPDRLEKEIENLIRARASMSKTGTTFDPAYVMKSINNSAGGSKINEKSIVS